MAEQTSVEADAEDANTRRAKADPEPDEKTPIRPQPSPRALLLTIDGLGGTYLDSAIAEGRLPNWRWLCERGASTHNARVDYAQPFTLPGHTSIITGRPATEVDGMPETTHHGYLGNNDPEPGETLHNSGNPAVEYIASVFDVIHDAGKRTCLYAGKTKFSLFQQSYDTSNGAPDLVGKDDGRQKIDRFFANNHDTPAILELLAADLAEDACDFAMIHLTELDREDHDIEWGGEEWMRILDQVDEWLGSVLSLLEEAGGVGERWSVVVTADHGGTGTNHFRASEPSTYQIPLVIVGSGVEEGIDFYKLAEPSRTDPGDERPSYSEANQPLRNGDAANIVLSLMRLPPVPGSLMQGVNLQ